MAQKEAPAHLMMLATAEEEFRAAHGHYTSDLVALKFEPDFSAETVGYVYGFARPSMAAPAPGEDPSRFDVIRTGKAWKASGWIDAYAGGRYELPETAVVTSDGFLAAAIADIAPSKPGLDVWTIDEKLALLRVRDDC